MILLVGDCIPREGQFFQISKEPHLEFQDPKKEVLYNIRPYFVEIFSHIGLT